MVAVSEQRERAADLHRRRQRSTAADLHSTNLLDDLKGHAREQGQLVKDRYPEMSKTAFKFVVEETFGNIPVIGRPIEYAAGRVADGLYGRIDADDRLRVLASHVAEILNKEAAKTDGEDVRDLHSYFDDLVTERLKPQMQLDDGQPDEAEVIRERENDSSRRHRIPAQTVRDVVQAGMTEARDEIHEIRHEGESIGDALHDIGEEMLEARGGNQNGSPHEATTTHLLEKPTESDSLNVTSALPSPPAPDITPPEPTGALAHWGNGSDRLPATPVPAPGDETIEPAKIHGPGGH